MGEAEHDLGFKRLTLATWRQLDPAIGHLVTVDAAGTTTPVGPDDLAARILAVDLSDAVPLEIRKLFAVARGTLCYGACFYPLYTLGAGQLFRVQDAALAARCGAAGCPTNVRTFAARIGWAVAQGLIDAAERERWEAARRLRNHASHADRQDIYDPAMALGILRTTRDRIDALFQRKDRS